MTNSGIVSTLLLLLSALCGAHGCSTQVTGGDSESHFLDDCNAHCSTGLTCICGVCTRACSGQSDCTRAAGAAECRVPGGDCSDAPKACDVSCASDAVCKTLGERFACVAGRCRAAGAGASASRDAGVDVSNAVSTPPGSQTLDGTSTSDKPDGGCRLKTVPARPAAVNLGGDKEIVAAQHTVDFGDSGPTTTMLDPMRYLNIGFDLNGVCTQMQMPAMRGCVNHNDTGELTLQGPGGIDNEFGRTVQLARTQISNFTSDNISAQLADGTAANLLVHVTGYNGKPDDDLIRVSIYGAAQFDALTTGAKPAWDGNDVFPVGIDSVSNASIDAPKNLDPNAYVSGGKLVANLGSMSFRFHAGITSVFAVAMKVNLQGGRLVCDVTPTTVGRWGYTLDSCVLAGRWAADDLLQQLSAFPDPLDLQNPKPLCTDSSAYGVFKTTVCNEADTLSSAFGPTAACDALSFAFTFTTTPANLGDLYPVDTSSPQCPPSTDPKNDSCEPTSDSAAP